MADYEPRLRRGTGSFLRVTRMWDRLNRCQRARATRRCFLASCLKTTTTGNSIVTQTPITIERGPALRVMVIFPVRANALLTADNGMPGVGGVFRGVACGFFALAMGGRFGAGFRGNAVSDNFGGNKLPAGPSYQR
jgi:hypothetical protein